jgi:hypothetical protein
LTRLFQFKRLSLNFSLQKNLKKISDKHYLSESVRIIYSQQE